MKRIPTYLLLFIYATIIIKPVMPTLADGFAHLLNYSEHFATVHYEDGKYHVHHEYIESAKDITHDDSASNNITKKADNSNEYIMLHVFSNSFIPAFSQAPLSLLYPCLPFISLQKDFRPPISSIS